MFLEERAAMPQPTNRYKQWLWFVGLWLLGFGSTMALAYVIRFIMRL